MELSENTEIVRYPLSWKLWLEGKLHDIISISGSDCTALSSIDYTAFIEMKARRAANEFRYGVNLPHTSPRRVLAQITSR